MKKTKFEVEQELTEAQRKILYYKKKNQRLQKELEALQKEHDLLKGLYDSAIDEINSTTMYGSDIVV
jgi:chromosome segregation ATPase